MDVSPIEFIEYKLILYSNHTYFGNDLEVEIDVLNNTMLRLAFCILVLFSLFLNIEVLICLILMVFSVESVVVTIPQIP